MIRLGVLIAGGLAGAALALWLLGRYGERACDRLERQWRLA